MLEEIQKIDYDRFITSIFIDKEYRGQVAVLIKLNIELSRIKNKVSEPQLGLIRLQWWKDHIKELYNNPAKTAGHELKDGLQELIEECKSITYEDFEALIDARETDFEPNPFSKPEDLLRYLDNTAGTLNRMICKIISPELNIEESIISDISVAWGITAILRSMNINCSKGRWVLPMDMVKKHKLNLDDFGSFDFVKLSKKAVKELIEISNDLLEKSESRIKDKSYNKLKFIQAYLFLAKRHNMRIKKNDYDVLSKCYRVELGIIDLIKLYAHCF